MADLSTLVSELFGLQEKRVAVYHKLEEGHEAYMKTSPNYDFVNYRQVVHDCTEEFNGISCKILDIEGKFKDAGKTEVVKYIQELQDGEEKKLEVTAEYQLAKQKVIDEPGMEDHEIERNELKKRLNSILEQINGSLESLKYETEGL